MKHILAMLAAVVLPASTMSQSKQQITVTCAGTSEVFQTLEREFGEVPMWMGKSVQSNAVLVANPKTKSWSIVQFNDTVACVLTMGEGFSSSKTFIGKPI
jgi:hypothetical protein